MKRLYLAVLTAILIWPAAAQTPVTHEQLRAACVPKLKDAYLAIQAKRGKGTNAAEREVMRLCATAIEGHLVEAPPPAPPPPPPPPPPPAPPPTGEAFAFLKPLASLAAGQSVAVPNTKMAACIVNDLSDLMRATSGTRAIFTDWASTALLRETSRLVYWGGGHAATHDASVYERDLMTGACRRAWRTYDMGEPRPGYPIGVMFERDGVTVQAPEKAPRSAHAYAGLLAIPGRDAFLVVHTNALQPVKPIAAWTGPWADWEFDFARLARGENPWKALPGKPLFDPPSGVVLRPDGKLIVHANNDYVKDLATGAVKTSYRNTGSINEGTAVYDSKRDATILAAIDNGVYQIDHKGGVMSPDWQRLFAWADIGPLGKRGAPGVVYHAKRDLVVLWDGRREFGWFGADRKLVRWTAPGVYPMNGPWSVNHKIHHLPELGPDTFLLVGGPDDDLTLVALPFDNPGAPVPGQPPAPLPTSGGVTLITPLDNVQAKFDAAAAGPVSADGWRIVKIAAGLYQQAAFLRGSNTRVECADGAIFRDKAVDGKAAIVIQANDIEWIGCRFEHPSTNFETVGNLAAFRLEAKNITFRKVYIRDYQMGILGGSIYGWKDKRNQAGRGYVRIFDSTIEDIGKVSFDNKLYQNLSHNIYIAAYDELTVERSAFRRSWASGHLLKSRCRATNVSDSTFEMGDAPTSNALDLPNGGTATLKNLTIQHGRKADNADVIGFGKEYWSDVAKFTIAGHEYFGLTSQREILFPGPNVLTVDNVSITTDVVEIPSWEWAVWGVRGPNIPEVELRFKGLTMRATHGVARQFATRPFDDLGGNAK